MEYSVPRYVLSKQSMMMLQHVLYPLQIFLFVIDILSYGPITVTAFQSLVTTMNVYQTIHHRCHDAATTTRNGICYHHLIDPNSAITRIRSRPWVVSSSSSSLSSSTAPYEYALLFDCDGVILETEELHRIAYNKAFEYYNCTINNEPIVWSVEYYDILQNTVGGGKPKMFYYFRTTRKEQFPQYTIDDVLYASPQTDDEQKILVNMLQDYKTQYYTTLLQTQATARPGVLELMDEAFLDPTIAVGVCSAATKAAAVQTLNITLGPDRVKRLDVCILGDDVSAKKPDPLIYNTACQQLKMIPSQCIVIEDSLVGLRAAVRANMKCIITYTSSTVNQDFYQEGAVAKVPDLYSRNVTLQSIFGPLRQNGNDAEILIGLKD
jgi:HAD superfamily hydrolase (TIGR01509 family)